ncbi:MAG: OmpA family protein, partial [Bacteroidota bacterium]
LGSHTDARGTTEYNRDLSQRRANQAVQYIISRGIQAHRITASGYGESQLTNRCADEVNCNEQEHQRNRRTEVRITKFNASNTIISR